MRNISFLAFIVLGIYCADELKFSTVIFRHGARSPLVDIPEMNQEWDTGFGELTPSGQRQHYLLGRMLRKRYIEDLHFISQSYNQSEVYVRSTPVHRTIMSAQCLSLGLYYDNLEKLTPQQLKNETIWTPPVNLTIQRYIIDELKDSALPFNIPVVPIVSYNSTYDKLLSFGSCPNYEHKRGTFYHTKKFEEVYAKYRPSLLKACSILKVDCSAVDKAQVFSYADYIIASEFDERFPELKKEPGLVDDMLKLYAALMIGELSVDSDMSSVRMNDFSKVIPEYMRNTMTTPKKGPKLALLSTHDSTLLGYLLSFGIQDPKVFEKIPYASHIIIELTKAEGAKDDDETAYYVNATYNGEQLIPKTSFKDFVKNLEKIGKLDGKWEDICRLNVKSISNTLDQYTTEIVLVCLAIILAFCIVVLGVRKYRKKKNEDKSTPTSEYTHIGQVSTV